MLNSLRSPESKRRYRHAIDEFVEWYCSEPRLSLNKTVVTRYRTHLEDRRLAPGTIKWTPSRCPPSRLRSGTFWSAQSRTGRWHTPREGSEETGRSIRPLAHL